MMKENKSMGIDIMNRNSISSLAMLYALMRDDMQDMLSLIQPFVLYAVNESTKLGQRIDLQQVSNIIEREFGYKNIPASVLERILKRETSAKKAEVDRVIKRESNSFILIKSWAEEADAFAQKRLHCKEHSDAVVTALTDHLNQHRVCGRENYTASEVEKYILTFFSDMGGSVLQSVEDLQQVTYKNNEVNYYIGRFILEQAHYNTKLIDYLIELVKGYFITIALYLQPDNTDITKASFKNVTFYLDTSILLAFLGYKTDEENQSVRAMVKSLQKNGATIACFLYNIEEVENILTAYKNSILSKRVHPSTITLEGFDKMHASSAQIDYEIRFFEKRLNKEGIRAVKTADLIEAENVQDETGGLLDDEQITRILKSINSKYNLETLPDDLRAINAISRIRRGRRLPSIERCKAVFVTKNTALVSATKQCIDEMHCDYGFPIAITGEDLCVIAWIKDFSVDSSLPRMRLLENVMASITPSRELMEEYFKLLDRMEQDGDIDIDDVALFRVDMFARSELMKKTRGEKRQLTEDVILSIKEKIKEEGYSEGKQKGYEDAVLENKEMLKEKKNLACKRAEEEVLAEYKRIEAHWLNTGKWASIIVSALFIISCVIVTMSSHTSIVMRIASWVVAIVTTIQAVASILCKDNFLNKLIKKKVEDKRLEETDKRKKQYLSLLE